MPMPCFVAGLGSIRPRQIHLHHRLAAHEPAHLLLVLALLMLVLRLLERLLTAARSLALHLPPAWLPTRRNHPFHSGRK